MARPPDWFARLDAIVELIAREAPATLGRQEIRALFGCSERDSIRLLHKFGAARAADALALSREVLLARLRDIQAGEAYAAYCRQRQEVARALAAAQAENFARRRRIPGHADFQPGKSLADLPAGLRLQPGRITCEFAYSDDFWAMIDALADFAAQHPEAFEQATLPEDPS